MVQDGILGVETSLAGDAVVAAFFDVPSSVDEVKNHWKRIENAFCVVMETTTTTIEQFISTWRWHFELAI